VSDACAHAVRVPIGSIFPPRLALAAQVGAQIRTADFEQRAKDGARCGMDAAKSGESRATQDVRQDGFRLIVGGVRDGDAVEPAFLREALKKGVSRAPRHIFQIAVFAFGFRGNIFRGHKKLQTMLRRKFRNEFFVGLRGPAAQFVIEVHDAQHAAQFLPQFQEQMQQSDGIRAPRNGNAQALARAQQTGALQEQQQALGEMVSPGLSLPMRFSLH